MAYGRNRNELLIKEGTLNVGDVSNPQNISPGSNPSTSFTLENVGWFQQGTCDPQINREYAEFLGGTPAILVRKDLIRKSFIINAQLAQFNADLFALVQGLDVETGTYDLGWIGPDEVVQSEYAYSIETFLVDGTPFTLYMFSGRQTGEAVGPKLPGNAHSTYDFKAEAFPHEGFTDDTRSYGVFVFEQAS